MGSDQSVYPGTLPVQSITLIAGLDSGAKYATGVVSARSITMCAGDLQRPSMRCLVR